MTLPECVGRLVRVEMCLQGLRALHRCSAEGVATAVGTALLAAFAIGVVGLVVTVIQLNRRKAGWPFAVATFVLCALAVVLGGVGSAMAVGG